MRGKHSKLGYPHQYADGLLRWAAVEAGRILNATCCL